MKANSFIKDIVYPFIKHREFEHCFVGWYTTLLVGSAICFYFILLSFKKIYINHQLFFFIFHIVLLC